MRPVFDPRQCGATTVEFAMVLILFLTFLLGILDFSRMLFTWNAAAEATRAGARYAAVCDDKTNKAKVLAKMQAMLPQITDINLAWEDSLGNSACTTDTCVGVTVTIVGLNYQWISPIAGRTLASIAMPPATFRTYLPREIMGKDPNSGAIC